MTTTYEGQLEIDHDRGVIYFHSSKTGATLLRICRLPAPIPDPEKGGSEYKGRLPQMIDVTHLYGVSYDPERTRALEKVKK